MKVFKPKDSRIKNIVRDVDENIIKRLVYECFKIKKDDEFSKIYSYFYDTKYPVQDLAISEQKLIEYLTKMAENKSAVMRTKTQGKEYRWVIIDEKHLGDTVFRYYFAPNPKNMHEIVKRLTDKFIERNIPVKFKFQLKDKMNECDRIILYSDKQHQKDIEQVIQSIYQEHSKLFDGSERSISWIYTSNTPNVYLAPETPESSYGEEFAKTMVEAKGIFSYLYNLTDANNSINLHGEEARKLVDFMEFIVGSLMLRKGLLLSIDGKRIGFKDNIITSYNYKTGELTSYCDDNYGHHRVVFSQSMDGKKALLDEFYNISQIHPQKGISVKHLTQKERRKELHEIFGWYADEFGKKGDASENRL